MNDRERNRLAKSREAVRTVLTSYANQYRFTLSGKVNHEFAQAEADRAILAFDTAIENEADESLAGTHNAD